MDGLLFDTEKLFDIAWHRVADKHGLTLTQEFFNTSRGSRVIIMIKANSNDESRLSSPLPAIKINHWYAA